MTEPTFDAAGCPTEVTLEFIRSDKLDGWGKYLRFCRACFSEEYGRWTQTAGRLEVATGGWSNNEAVVEAMLDNIYLRTFAWQSSHRGGLHVWEHRAIPT